MRSAQSELAVSQAVPLKKDDINTLGESLHSSYEAADRSPTQASLEAVDGLAHTVQDAFPFVDADNSPRAGLDAVDGHIGAISPPADRSSGRN